MRQVKSSSWSLASKSDRIGVTNMEVSGIKTRTPEPSDSSSPYPTYFRIPIMRNVSKGQLGELTIGDETTLSSSWLNVRNFKLIVHLASDTTECYQLPGEMAGHVEYQKIMIPLMKEEDLALYFEPTSNSLAHYMKKGENVLVCCSSGKSKAVAVSLAYMVKSEGKTLVEALKSLSSSGSLVSLDPSLETALIDWERQCHGTTSLQPGSFCSIIVTPCQSSPPSSSLIKSSLEPPRLANGHFSVLSGRQSTASPLLLTDSHTLTPQLPNHYNSTHVEPSLLAKGATASHPSSSWLFTPSLRLTTEVSPTPLAPPWDTSQLSLSKDTDDLTALAKAMLERLKVTPPLSNRTYPPIPLDGISSKLTPKDFVPPNLVEKFEADRARGYELSSIKNCPWGSVLVHVDSVPAENPPKKEPYNTRRVSLAASPNVKVTIIPPSAKSANVNGQSLTTSSGSSRSASPLSSSSSSAGNNPKKRNSDSRDDGFLQKRKHPRAAATRAALSNEYIFMDDDDDDFDDLEGELAPATKKRATSSSKLTPEVKPGRQSPHISHPQMATMPQNQMPIVMMPPQPTHMMQMGQQNGAKLAGFDVTNAAYAASQMAQYGYMQPLQQQGPFTMFPQDYWYYQQLMAAAYGAPFHYYTAPLWQAQMMTIQSPSGTGPTSMKGIVNGLGENLMTPAGPAAPTPTAMPRPFAHSRPNSPSSSSSSRGNDQADASNLLALIATATAEGSMSPASFSSPTTTSKPRNSEKRLATPQGSSTSRAFESRPSYHQHGRLKHIKFTTGELSPVQRAAIAQDLEVPPYMVNRDIGSTLKQVEGLPAVWTSNSSARDPRHSQQLSPPYVRPDTDAVTALQALKSFASDK